MFCISYIYIYHIPYIIHHISYIIYHISDNISYIYVLNKNIQVSAVQFGFCSGGGSCAVLYVYMWYCIIISANPSKEQGERIREKVSFRHCRSCQCLQLGAASPLRRVAEAPRAGLDTIPFLWVQKVTLETAVSGLEGWVDPSAGCCLHYLFRLVQKVKLRMLGVKLPSGFRKCC